MYKYFFNGFCMKEGIGLEKKTYKNFPFLLKVTFQPQKGPITEKYKKCQAAKIATFKL